MKRTWTILEIEVVRDAPPVGVALAVSLPLLIALAMIIYGPIK